MVWGPISRKNKRHLLLKNVQIRHAASRSMDTKEWVVSFAGIKPSQREVDRSPPSTARVKNKRGYNSAPSVRLSGADGGKFYLNFPLRHMELSCLFVLSYVDLTDNVLTICHCVRCHSP
jgi:hypothetical protein